MIWTKLKRTAESLLAGSLQGRISYHMTRYGPGVSMLMARGWITFDQHEIASFSTIQRVCASYHTSGTWHQQEPQAQVMLDAEGLFTRDALVNALESYVQLPIEQSTHATMPIVRAIAMFDRRLGKRRLNSLRLEANSHPLIDRCLRIRCQAEGLPDTPSDA